MLTREAFYAAAVAPPRSWSRSALRTLGVDLDRTEAAAATLHRATVAVALSGVRTKPTTAYPEGVSRGALIRSCGRQHAWLVGESFALEPKCCRQRPCPSCARARARKNGRDVIAAVDARKAAAGSMFVFATLTQVKLPAHAPIPRRTEGPREAVERIVTTWGRLTNSRRAMGRWFHAIFRGGLRSTETTYSRKGDPHFHGKGRVAESGYHAHLHVMLEVRDGVDRGQAIVWLRKAWLLLSPGSKAISQKLLAAKPKHCEQLCKYVTKPLEDNASRPAVLRELFAGLHGLRLLQAFGEWQARAGVRDGWRSLVPDDPGTDLPRYQGPEIGELLRVATHPLDGTTDRVTFVGVRPGDERMVSAAEAWAAIEASIEARVELDADRVLARRKTPARAGAPPPD